MRRMDKVDLQTTLPSAVARSDLPTAPPVERRAGRDRRDAEIGPPSRHERRTTLEARKPQVVELEMSPSEWAMFGGPPPGAR
jgi:hypothetical protein